MSTYVLKILLHRRYFPNILRERTTTWTYIPPPTNFPLLNGPTYKNFLFGPQVKMFGGLCCKQTNTKNIQKIISFKTTEIQIKDDSLETFHLILLKIIILSSYQFTIKCNYYNFIKIYYFYNYQTIFITIVLQTETIPFS